MKWVKRFSPQQSTAQRIMKKIARNEKMSKKIPKLPESIGSNTNTKKKAELAPEQYFTLCNGENLKSIQDLAKQIEGLDEGHYSHHVTTEKNDFANWVSGVFEEQELAETLRASETQQESHVALLKHLAFKK